MYIVFAIDAKTGTIREEIPFNSLSFTTKLNGIGSWSMDLPMTYLDSSGYNKLSRTTAEIGRTVFVITRDGTPLFAGLFMQEDGSFGDGESVSFAGPDAVMGYLSMRVLLNNYSVLARDQLQIVDDLIDEVNDIPLFGGLNVEYPALSGVLRQRTWYASGAYNIATLIDNLSAVIDGFDYLSEVSGFQEAGFDLDLRLGYPELKRRTSFVLDLNKNITNLRYTYDGSNLVNTFVAIGGSFSGENDALKATAYAPEKWALYPSYDKANRFDIDTDGSALLDHAQEGLARFKEPVTGINVTVNASDTDSTLGSFRAGDEFRLIAQRGRLDIDQYARVFEYTIDVDRDGVESLQMTLIPSI